MRCSKCFRQRSCVAAILSLLVAKVDPMIEIVAGDLSPDLPFVIVNREGCHIDLTGIGQLWDGPTVASIRRALSSSSAACDGLRRTRALLSFGTSAPAPTGFTFPHSPPRLCLVSEGRRVATHRRTGWRSGGARHSAGHAGAGPRRAAVGISALLPVAPAAAYLQMFKRLSAPMAYG